MPRPPFEGFADRTCCAGGRGRARHLRRRHIQAYRTRKVCANSTPIASMGKMAVADARAPPGRAWEVNIKDLQRGSGREFQGLRYENALFFLSAEPCRNYASGDYERVSKLGRGRNPSDDCRVWFWGNSRQRKCLARDRVRRSRQLERWTGYGHCGIRFQLGQRADSAKWVLEQLHAFHNQQSPYHQYHA